MSGIKKVKLNLPADIHGAVALSYDLEMCAGYSPIGVNHGRIIPEIQEYTLKLCKIAENYNTKLHFFYVCNGLEENNIEYLKEIRDRGHVIDSHTYSHQGVAIVSPDVLDEELRKANQLLKERLKINSYILRGPYGYKFGELPAENRRVILNNGFKWISGEYNDEVFQHDYNFWIRCAERDLPYCFEDGLMEIPFQGWSDRMWFDMRPEVDQSLIAAWRKEYGHKAVPKGWKAPWTPENALEEWIHLIINTFDYTYHQKLLWVPVWHPYTHYLHDPECRTLEALLSHATSKSYKAPICTLRDAIEWLKPCE